MPRNRGTRYRNRLIGRGSRGQTTDYLREEKLHHYEPRTIGMDSGKVELRDVSW